MHEETVPGNRWSDRKELLRRRATTRATSLRPLDLLSSLSVTCVL